MWFFFLELIYAFPLYTNLEKFNPVSFTFGLILDILNKKSHPLKVIPLLTGCVVNLGVIPGYTAVTG